MVNAPASVMSKRVICLFLVTACFCLMQLHADEAVPDNPDSDNTLDSPVMVGMSTSFSMCVASSYFLPLFNIAAPEIFIRLFDIIDIAVFASSQNIRLFLGGESHIVATSPLYRFEVRIAPRAGFYFPMIGAGFVYMGLNQDLFNGHDALISPCVSVSPLRFALKDAVKGNIWYPFVSFGDFRYGSILSTGSYPGFYNPGGFIVNIDIIRVGVVIDPGTADKR